MDQEKKRSKSTGKQVFPKYLFIITIIISILVSGSVGYATSRVVINASDREASEMKLLKEDMMKARTDSIKVIETEVPKIMSDLEKYNQDIILINENISWLDKNLAPITAATDQFDTAISFIVNANSLVKIPVVDKVSSELSFAQVQLEDINGMLIHLEDLSLIQKEISYSHQKVELLYAEYEKDKSVDQLLLIQEELDSNLIYQIEDLRTLTPEAYEVFEVSSNVLLTIEQIKSMYNSIEETGKNALKTIQFWKENEEDPEIGSDIKEDLKEDFKTSKEDLQNLPDELTQRSKETINSINLVQQELQTLKMTQMVIGE
ncbi:hypothetical protein [Jeotgalibacillus aurantiacus]|uniref:hypothetical protein n=1 Tax=Jeotgalibacillus aurantiacus TaxID=2763266 RepID=UPI001D0B7ABF|nr:hypothetical protein [Jeotgalibacillus aurantiacus]